MIDQLKHRFDPEIPKLFVDFLVNSMMKGMTIDIIMALDFLQHYFQDDK